tara:strand:+ start:366 stop:491 length:126 start_codon:yes stop_codon:yes gene_type:complete
VTKKPVPVSGAGFVVFGMGERLVASECVEQGGIVKARRPRA